MIFNDMKKLLLLTLSAIIAIQSVSAQKNKSVFFELGGNGLFMSANFDTRFTKSEKGFGCRIGIGFIPALDLVVASSSAILTIPVGINYLGGKAPHYFEGGLGATFISGSVDIFDEEGDNSTAIGFIPSVGYRYAPLGKAIQFRVVLSPVINGNASFWAGFSVGFKF